MSARIISLKDASVAAAIRKLHAGQLRAPAPRRAVNGPIHTGQMGLSVPGCATPNQPVGEECAPYGCDLPAALGRKVPGWRGDCKTLALTLVSEDLAASGTDTIEVTSKITMCARRLVVVTTGSAGFTMRNFFINNEAQWVRDNIFHSQHFANLAFGVDLRGDCVVPGSTISMDITNLDGDNAQSFYAMLIGPAIS